MEQYQDIWVNGKLQKAGVRECEKRYQIIKEQCKHLGRGFTVLDLGGNLGYFSIRLAEDFDARCVIVEHNYSSRLIEVLKQQKGVHLIHLNTVINKAFLKEIAKCELFDMTICMSVLHHFDDMEYEEAVKLVQATAIDCMIELPHEDRACHAAKGQGMKPINGMALVGYGDSHLDNSQRKIYHCPGTHTGRLSMKWYGQKSGGGSDREKSSADWISGINLVTYMSCGGSWPTKEMMGIMVESAECPRPHGDVAMWNIIVDGRDAHLIDFDDPCVRTTPNKGRDILKLIAMGVLVSAGELRLPPEWN